MNACFCVLGGTKACETCQNNDQNSIIVDGVTITASKYLKDGEWILIHDKKIIANGEGIKNEQKPS